MKKHQGGCHCGRVRFEVLASSVINVSQCNCSICSKSGFLGMCSGLIKPDTNLGGNIAAVSEVWVATIQPHVIGPGKFPVSSIPKSNQKNEKQ